MTGCPAHPTTRSHSSLARSVAPLRVGVCVVAVVSSGGSPAFADDISADARRVETFWSATSQRVLHLAPQFLVSGEVRPIPLSRTALASSDAECTTIGVLGAPTMDFSLEVRGDEAAEAKTVVRESDGVRSVAGALTVIRCGDARKELEGLAIRMKSPQGALEVLIARGPVAAPPLDALFPERMAGPSVSEAEQEPPPIAVPRAARVADAEAGILQNGGRIASRQEVTSDREGRGSVQLALAEGCHRLVVVAESRGGASSGPIDVDCELLNEAREVLERDRSFAPDGQVQTCVGTTTNVVLRWAGAPAISPTLVMEGIWAIPEAIPEDWPARARAGLTGAAIRRHVPLSDPGPVWEGSGVTARTSIPLPVSPGVCYVVGVGASAGDVRAMRLSVRQGANFASDSGMAGSDGAALSFCAESSETARLDVNAIGTQVTWFVGMWAVSTMQLGLEETK